MKKRKIQYIVVHCTATPIDTSISSICNYWKNILGWQNPGYHVIIDHAGNITQLLDVDDIANGVKGYNKESLHIAYIGGVNADGIPEDTKSKDQEIALLKLLLKYREVYPDAIILGHRDFPNVAKACPSFNVKEWLS